MADLSSILNKPQGYVRLILSIVLVLGAIGATPGLKHSNINFAWCTVIDIAVAGGALVAISLLLAGSEGDNSVAEITCDIVYVLLTFVGMILLIVFMTSDNSSYSRSVGLYLLAACIVVSFILWVIDFALDIKDNFC